MQVACLLEHRPARLGKLLEGEVKQSVVIGLYRKIAPVAQYTRIPCEKAAIGQAALCTTRLRPRVAEIQIYPIYRVRREQLVDAVGISRIKAQIIRAAALECHSLFHSEHDNIGHQLYGDKIIPGIPDRRLGYKAPLAAAYLDPQRLVGLAEHMRRISGKEVRTRSETALAVTFFSYSHIAIYSVI